MSSIFDIKDAYNTKKINIEVPGWKPLVAIYGLYRVSEQIYILWNIEGTDHTFAVPIEFVYKKNAGEISVHIMETLKVFREDLLSWRKENLPEEWMRKYNYEFYGLLVF